MSDRKDNVWPEKLWIRDTQLYDDIGGAGQRIYTTAGQGYEKHYYYHEDILKAKDKEIERLTASDALGWETANRCADERNAALAKNAKLQAVVDAVIAESIFCEEIVDGPHKNWPKLRKALAALEDE